MQSPTKKTPEHLLKSKGGGDMKHAIKMVRARDFYPAMQCSISKFLSLLRFSPRLQNHRRGQASYFHPEFILTF